MQRNNAFKFLAVVAAMTAGLFAESAQATPITFTTSGTITSGTDVTGKFSNGVLNTNLAGDAYTDSVTLNPALYLTQSDTSEEDVGSGNLAGGATVTETITIKGVSQTFILNLTPNSNSNNNETFLENNALNFAEAQQIVNGATADGTTVSSKNYVINYANVSNLGVSFNQNWSYAIPTNSGDATLAYVAVDGVDADVSFTANVTSISINSGTTVPEPMTPALVGLGLMALAVARRQGRQSI